MSSHPLSNSTSPLSAQHDLFPRENFFSNSMKVGLAVVAVIATIFAVLMGMNYLFPYSAVVAGGLVGVEILVIVIRYCMRKSGSQKPLPSTQRHSVPKEISHSTKPLKIPENPHDQSNWHVMLQTLDPKRANLVEGSERIGENTAAGFHPVPYIGNYAHYDHLRAPFIQWRLPASQLAGFPDEMQRLFAGYAQKGLLDVFFIASNDLTEEMNLTRNLIMHALALPEYDPANPRPSTAPSGVDCCSGGGLATTVKMRIFESNGIKPCKNGIPFHGANAAQRVIYHPSYGTGGIAISPNNARFIIQKDSKYCSFYVGALYRGRAVVFYAIIDRNKDGVLAEAVRSAGNCLDFSARIKGVFFYENINKLLTYY